MRGRKRRRKNIKQELKRKNQSVDILTCVNNECFEVKLGYVIDCYIRHMTLRDGMQKKNIYFDIGSYI